MFTLSCQTELSLDLATKALNWVIATANDPTSLMLVGESFRRTIPSGIDRIYV